MNGGLIRTTKWAAVSKIFYLLLLIWKFLLTNTRLLLLTGSKTNRSVFQWTEEAISFQNSHDLQKRSWSSSSPFNITSEISIVSEGVSTEPETEATVFLLVTWSEVGNKNPYLILLLSRFSHPPTPSFQNPSLLVEFLQLWPEWKRVLWFEAGRAQ